jgi:hypothetical protein
MRSGTPAIHTRLPDILLVIEDIVSLFYQIMRSIAFLELMEV